MAMNLVNSLEQFFPMNREAFPYIGNTDQKH